MKFNDPMEQFIERLVIQRRQEQAKGDRLTVELAQAKQEIHKLKRRIEELEEAA